MLNKKFERKANVDLWVKKQAISLQTSGWRPFVKQAISLQTGDLEAFTTVVRRTVCLRDVVTSAEHVMNATYVVQTLSETQTDSVQMMRTWWRDKDEFSAKAYDLVLQRSHQDELL